MCWPTVPAGTVLHLPCPTHVFGTSKLDDAVRACNLTEEVNSGSIRWQYGKTDYSRCLEFQNEYMAQLGVLRKIGHVVYAFSTLSLTTAIGILVHLRKLRCPRNNIHLNLFLAILLRCYANYLREWTDTLITQQLVLCRLLVTVSNFAAMATYSWVFVEALFLHNTVLVHVMNSNAVPLMFYILLGWGAATVATTIWVFLRILSDTGGNCWILEGLYSPTKMILVGYPTILILLNLAFFVNILRVILVKMQAQEMSESTRLKQFLRSIAVLVLVFGIYHVLSIPMDLMPQRETMTLLELIKLYYEMIMNASQGCFVAILLCFTNKEITNELRRRYQARNWRATSTRPSETELVVSRSLAWKPTPRRRSQRKFPAVGSHSGQV